MVVETFKNERNVSRQAHEQLKRIDLEERMGRLETKVNNLEARP
jgi:hypothetical protein